MKQPIDHMIGNAGDRLPQLWDLLDSSEAAFERTGFENRIDSTISFDKETKTFTIKPTAELYNIFINSVKETKRAVETIAIDDVEGIWFIYFDLDFVIQRTQIFTNDIITKFVLIKILYWDSTNKQLLLDEPLEERHGLSMPGITHLRWHTKFGANLTDGAALNSNLADQTGALDSHAQFGIDSGVFYDEDLEHILNSQVAPALSDVLYKTGVNGDWRYKPRDVFPVISFSGGNGLLAYNEFTGGAWQQTEVSNGRFVLAHCYLINGDTKKMVFIQGENTYLNQVSAREGAEIEIDNIKLDGLPSPEMIAIGTIIYQVSTSYTNSIKARIRTTDTGNDYVDFRTL